MKDVPISKILARATEMQALETAGILLLSKSNTLFPLKAAIFALCTFLFSLLPLGGAATTFF